MSRKGKAIDGLSASRPTRQPVGVSRNSPRRKLNTQSISRSRSVSGTKKRGKTSDFLKPMSSYDFDLNSEDLKKGRKKRTSKNNQKKGKKGKGWKNWSKKRKILTVIGLLLLAAIIALIVWFNIILSKMTNGQSGVWDALWSDGVDLKKDKNNRTNILIFGTSGYDMEGSEGNTAHDGAQLTDSIMVVSLDQDTKDIAMVNIPRDLKVSDACSAGKINEVYWCNNQDNKHEVEGAQALMNDVQKVLGVDIHYYAHINWGSLVQVVDSIGGITVTLDEDIADSWTKTYIKAGVPTTLNGEQALGLARARHGTAGGDFSRGNSQQKILIALEQKILEKGINITDAWNMMNVLGDNVRMSFKADEIKRLVKLAKEFDLKNIRQVPLVNTSTGVDYITTATIGGVSYVVPSAGVEKYTDIHQYIAKMFSSDPAKRENANIMILNGSKTAGVASSEKDKLTAEGLTVGYVGDAPSTEYSGVSIYAVNDKNPGTKSLLEKHYGVTAQPATSIPKGIITDGYDFVIIIGNQANTTTNTTSGSTAQ